MSARADELVRLLDLRPHPEGGAFRETFRSAATVAPGDGRPARSGLTGIYCLYRAGQHSAWHVVESDEIWTFVEGDPLRLFLFDPASGAVETLLLGPLTLPGCAPQRAVRAGIWQAGEPTGEYTLGACFVGPGFDFADFRMLDRAPEARSAIERAAPELLRLA